MSVREDERTNNRVNQDGVAQTVFAECSICTLDYGLDSERLPRVLNCGHSFCNSCLLQWITYDIIVCPFCHAKTRVMFGDINRIPVNYGILDMLQVQPRPPEVDRNLDDLCEACGEEMATIVCVSCSPMGVKFCSQCDKREHNRNFRPAQLHRRVDIQDYCVAIMCSRHDGKAALFYSESLNQFACDQCQSDSDWSTRQRKFLKIADASEYLRGKAGKLSYRCSSSLQSLYDTQRMLKKTLEDLATSASQSKVKITNEFQKLQDVLEQRRKTLITRVDQEEKSRKENIEKQWDKLKERSHNLSTHHDALKDLLSQPVDGFLRGYNHVIEGVRSIIDHEDSYLLRPVAPGDIPCSFQDDLMAVLEKHGAVGGGSVPLNLACQNFRLRNCSLPQLSWGLPSDSTEITRYEVEYDHMPDERPVSPNNSGPQNLQLQPKPVIVSKSGKAQACIMNDLHPGHRYRFRVRSCSIAGWGMWSQPITGRFEGFPVRIAFTGDIFSFKIPCTGMYRITAAGAKAADGLRYKGGLGAIISGTFTLQTNDRLEVAVGGMSRRGTEGHSGGGGGTFVLLCNNGLPTLNNLLIAAGGGGGTRGFDDLDEDGADANLDTYGTNGLGKENGQGGVDGLPGADADMTWYHGPCWGHGGAGFLKSSRTAKCYAEGLEGGQCGGYGGGGGVGLLGGGGGGGFSGGGGGRGGGGGGSYIKDMAHNISKTIGNDGNGYVLVEKATLNQHTSFSNDKNVDILADDNTLPIVNGGYPCQTDFDIGSNGSSPNATASHSY